MLISFSTGLLFGLLNVLFKSPIITSLNSPLYSDIGSFLTSVGCWVMLPYIVARSKLSKTRRLAVINSILVLVGSMIGYHGGYYYGIGVYGVDSIFDALSLYDYLWFLIACIFGAIFGFCIYPTQLAWRNKVINLNDWQQCFVFATCIAESLWWPIWYSDHSEFDFPFHLIVELSVGFLFFIISNYKHLRSTKLYLHLFILSFLEFICILLTYICLYAILYYFGAPHPEVYLFS